jgi:hypothetical protein
MQTIPTKPKRSTLSKLLIGAVAIILACCGLSAVAAVFSPRAATTPTPTVAVVVSMSTQEAMPTIASPTKSPTHTPLPPTPTAEATVPPTAAPTDPPAPTEAPAMSLMSVSEYSTAIGGIAFRSTDNLSAFTRLIDRAGRNVALVTNNDWKTEMNTVLATMRVHAGEFRRLSPPSNMRDVHSLILEMADRMERIADNMSNVVNKQDFSKLDQVTEDLNMITALAQQITAMLKSK